MAAPQYATGSPVSTDRYADLVVDRAFGNVAVKLGTFGAVFAVVALVRYAQRST